MTNWRRHFRPPRVVVYVLIALLLFFVAGCVMFAMGTDEQGGVEDVRAAALAS